MNNIFNTRNINKIKTLINLFVPQIAGNFLTWWASPGLFNMKLIFQVLINISSHCTNNCNNTCIVYMFHHSQDLQIIATVYILSLAASVPFRSRLFFQKNFPPQDPINFTPFLHYVICSAYSTGAYFPYLKKKNNFLIPSFRKEYNACGMYTPVKNALNPNDFITFVQQRHGSYSHRPKLLQGNQLGPKSFHVWFLVDWEILEFLSV